MAEKKIWFLVQWTNKKYPKYMPSKYVNVKCPQLVIEYYEHLYLKVVYGIDDNKIIENPNMNIDCDFTMTEKKYDDCLVEKIIDTAYTNEEFWFMVTWKNENKPELVLSEIVHRKWPHIVIEYYEKWLKS